MCNLFRTFAGTAVLWAAVTASATAEVLSPARFCSNDRPPDASVDQGDAAGLPVGILRAAARRAGFAPRFVALPWQRCLNAVETGELDAVMDATERPQFVHGIVSFAADTNTFRVRADDALVRFDRTASTGRRLGIVDGYAHGEALDRLFAKTGVVLDRSVDDGALVRKLGFGRTGTVVADHVGTRLPAAAEGLNPRPRQPPHAFDPLYPSFGPDRRDAMRAFDAALPAMCDDCGIARACRRHLGLPIVAVVGLDLGALPAAGDRRS